ncbi:N-terminal C2 in EEIG1 and EHBP1 proteins domain-containing protein [Trichoderma novae-zelandiae]
MPFFPPVGKGRKPRFDLHLKIFDLNNVPLVSGTSFIKWHLPHSMHADHRGRTAKAAIANHRVEYNFSKVITGVRMSVDKNNNLNECLLELEVVQEFALTEKITLGYIKINLAEFVEESETLMRDPASPPSSRRRNNSAGLSPTSARDLKLSDEIQRECEDGIVRRYLMQDSKVNSTLKVSILLIQVDGERNFIAPPLKTAPVFGGIVGFMAPEQTEDEILGPDATAALPTLSKNRDVAEVQDLYRRTLAASWTRQPSELPTDECIEDIFSGGNGWRTKHRSATSPDSDDEYYEEEGENSGSLRPTEYRRMAMNHRRNHSNSSSHFRPGSSYQPHNPNPHHRRTPSGSSDKSVSTVTVGGNRGPFKKGVRIRDDGRESTARDDDMVSTKSVGSLVSLAPTLGSSERERENMKRAKEIGESDVRDDLVAWSLPGSIAA